MRGPASGDERLNLTTFAFWLSYMPPFSWCNVLHNSAILTCVTIVLKGRNSFFRWESEIRSRQRTLWLIWEPENLLQSELAELSGMVMTKFGEA